MATNVAWVPTAFRAPDSAIRDAGGVNYACYRLSTTHLDGLHAGGAAVYVAFGEVLSFMRMPWSGS
jgi:hypothetical protein